ncbi:enoyl-CoA delta isomerase 2-like [Brevipalpus obovatus]|uniref:enoyl-CoA delta isomerase 2-like n=1 Tax=Brevipalpus obovatus TaxID=246614 RepID=UPI003D9E08B2
MAVGLRTILRLSKIERISYQLKQSRLLCSSLDVSNRFQAAMNKVNKLKEEPENEHKLQLYALYKQSTVGRCDSKQPGMFDIVAKFKWEAWSKLGDLSKEDAMKKYVETVEDLVKIIGVQEDTSTSSSGSTKGGDILTSTDRGVLKMTLNRPEKKNAITVDMYADITRILLDAAKDDNVKMIVFTGNGEYYSSGNDLSKMAVNSREDLEKLVHSGRKILQDFIDAIIDFPKPIIALVNGPAIGIMVTTLALFDTVICTDTATFSTPFLATAQNPEGCSSVTFPRIMGTSKANAMLLFNEKINANQAYECGLVSRVIPKNEIDSFLNSWLYSENGLIATGSTLMWKESKKLMRTESEKALLHATNNKECEVLAKMWLTPDFAKAMAKFMSRKK